MEHFDKAQFILSFTQEYDFVKVKVHLKKHKIVTILCAVKEN